MDYVEASLAGQVLGDRSTSGAVVDALRGEIIQGRLKPGERLRQDAVASRFGVSQTVVREAFKDLIRECFLASEPRRGVSVATMSAAEAEEMTRLRSLVEPQALAWAIPRLTAVQFEAAERVLKELDDEKNVDRIILLNARFHRGLYAAADRPRTLTMVETLRLGFERYLRYTWEFTSHRDRSQQEHWELLAMCKQGDVVNACTLLTQHISATGQLLVESLAKQPVQHSS
ncbi:GntR family transcriptional regulator [Variovorax sp. UMC13]|uniref:GntR family transcriptional regulator n=1 Tax=Variovorax sp. UMC13 TaxID=1862326 RepID=UPI0016026C49|nr:GntR family transcriptional regulator [Variovorax sp. UMC13]MBB1600501.1 GntR family transcriptional regulator [Variovorax sp. UMC13]